MLWYEPLERNQCTADSLFRLTDCLKAWVARQVGCALHWFQDSASSSVSSYPACSSKQQIQKTQNFLMWLKETGQDNVTDGTGCRVKCSTTSYSVTKVSPQTSKAAKVNCHCSRRLA